MRDFDRITLRPGVMGGKAGLLVLQTQLQARITDIANR
jgi:hypothetical protein